MADILTPELFNELDNLVRALQIKFNQPEFIAGCQVLSITDINEYATNNGWIEALCGHHNRQRVRWKSAEVIAINDYIDVIYFPDRRLFEAWGIGGSTAPAASAHAMLSASHSDSLAGTVSAGDIIIGNNTPAWARLARGTNGQVLTLASGLPSWADSTGGGWPFANILTVSTTDADADYSTLAAAITAASAGDAIRLDAGTLTESVTVDKNIFIIGYGAVLTSSSATTLTLSSRCRIIGLEVLNTASGASARCVQVSSGVAPPVLEYCRLLKISGTPTIGAALYISGSAGVELRECQINGSSGTSGYGIYADVLTSVIMRGGYLSGPTRAAYSTDAASTLILQNLPDITGPITFGNVSGYSAGFYTTVGNMYALRNTGIIGGVWLHYANGLRSWFSTITDAISVASSGDSIYLYPGTYTESVTVNKSISIIAENPATTIITLATNGVPTLTVSANNVKLSGLTIASTGAGTTTGAVSIGTYTGILIDNCILNKTSGAATNSYGVLLSGGSAVVHLRNTNVTVTTGTNMRAIQGGSGNNEITIEGGIIRGDTYDLYDGGFTENLFLKRPTLYNATKSWGTFIHGEIVDRYGRTGRVLPAGINAGRLTLTASTPVTTADVTAATSVKFTPYNGSSTEIYNGHFWIETEFVELSLSLSGFTADKNSDIWIYDNAGDATLERTEWTNDTTRATALAVQDGKYCKSGTLTRLYLGTIRTTGTTGQCEDSLVKRYVWNNYNRVPRQIYQYNYDTHTYSSTWRVFANNTAYKISFIVGVVDEFIKGFCNFGMKMPSPCGPFRVAFSLNSTTSPYGTGMYLANASGGSRLTFAYFPYNTSLLPRAGYNYMHPLEQTDSGTSPNYDDYYFDFLLNA